MGQLCRVLRVPMSRLSTDIGSDQATAPGHHPRCRLLLSELATQQIGDKSVWNIIFSHTSSSMFKSTNS